MKKKTGRNDPCPCGSGKKYKNCCLNMHDNVIPFPGRPDGDDALKRYQDMAEAWDPARGPVPSFMESMGKPNPATDALREIKAKMGDRVFQSEEELRDFINDQMRALNSAPHDDFLGLSPAQMRSITTGDFNGNSMIVGFNEIAPSDLFRGIPALDQCLYLLRALAQPEKGVRATQKGNFSRAIARDFYNVFLRQNALFDTTPMGEDDVREVGMLRFFLRDSGLIKLRNGWFSLTKEGRKMLEHNDLRAIYKRLFFYFAERFNWLYGANYPDSMEFLQRSLIFCLYILKVKAGDFVFGRELSEYYAKAFPALVEEGGEKFGRIFVCSGFSYMFLDRFACFLGLAEQRCSARVFLSEEKEFRASALFKNVLEWKV